MFWYIFVIILCSFKSVHYVLAQNCANPLLSQTYNVWAPFPNKTLSFAEIFDSLPICTNLNNQLSCCDKTIMNDYVRTWDIFKEYFDNQNKEQLKKMSTKVENAYMERANIISTYKNMNATLNASYSQLDQIRDSDIVINSSALNLSNESQTNFDNIFKFIEDSLNINVNQNEIRLNNYLDWSSNISEFLLNNTSEGNQQDYIRYLDSLDEKGLNEEINNTQIRFWELVTERTKCFSSLFRHFASLMCLSCETDYISNGIQIEQRKIVLNLNLDVCHSFEADCYGYLQKSVEMNKNAIFFANIDSLNDSVFNFSAVTNFALNQSGSSIIDLYNFFNDRSNAIINSLNNQILFEMPDNCSLDSCPWICVNYVTSTGLDFVKILNGTILPINNLNIFNINLNTRILESVNSLTIDFSEDFTMNTYTKALSTNLNYTVDGGAGIVLFASEENNLINFIEKINFNLLILYSWIILNFLN